MWTRANLKANAKVAFKRNYWKCVLVALLFGIATGAGSSGGSAVSTYSETQNIIDGTFYEEDIYDEEIHEEEFYDEDYYEETLPGAGVASGIFNVFSTTILVIIVLIGVIIAFALQYFVLGPLEVGCCNFFKNNAYELVDLNKITFGFKKTHYWKMAATMFLRNLYIALWALLFIIPGVIKAYEYRMVSYILTDCPDIPRQEAFRISKDMMYGNKWKTFLLDMSFLGWSILATITCGIAGIFYVKPYMAATDAELFIAIREEYFKNQRG